MPQRGEPVLDVENPAGVTRDVRRLALDALKDLKRNLIAKRVIPKPPRALRNTRWPFAADGGGPA